MEADVESYIYNGQWGFFVIRKDLRVWATVFNGKTLVLPAVVKTIKGEIALQFICTMRSYIYVIQYNSGQTLWILLFKPSVRHWWWTAGCFYWLTRENLWCEGQLSAIMLLQAFISTLEDEKWDIAKKKRTKEWKKEDEGGAGSPVLYLKKSRTSSNRHKKVVNFLFNFPARARVAFFSTPVFKRK